jgi:hypothetical protein
MSRSSPPQPRIHQGTAWTSVTSSRRETLTSLSRTHKKRRREMNQGERRTQKREAGRVTGLANSECRVQNSWRRRRHEWTGTESNRRHKDFQSFALPTELPVRQFRHVASATMLSERILQNPAGIRRDPKLPTNLRNPPRKINAPRRASHPSSTPRVQSPPSGSRWSPQRSC